MNEALGKGGKRLNYHKSVWFEEGYAAVPLGDRWWLVATSVNAR